MRQVSVMSDSDVKKPSNREELIKLLKEAMLKELKERAALKKAPLRPTISGTARALNIHRDTLYSWLKEFNVDFAEVAKTVEMPSDISLSEPNEHVYLIGEALVGEGNEVAHIDLIIGDKNGPVGEAFASGLAHMSAGHTPLLAVIRPNLPPKPHTLIVPKVTIKNMEQANAIFGPAQAAVAKAVADSVESGVIPKDQAEDLVIVCGVFIHWLAEDDKKIYDNNYKATLDSITNAMHGKPTADEMIAGKDAFKPGEAKNSWLTGTAAWNFYAVSQYILGIQPDYNGLKIDLCIPQKWQNLTITRKFRNAVYNIKIKNPNGNSKGIENITIDGILIPGNILPIFNDGEEHEVLVIMK